MNSLPMFNAETLAQVRPNELDLRRIDWKLDVICELMPDGMYWASDRASFDGDPESKWHITGRAKTKAEAIEDLLWGIMEALEQPEQRYEPISGITSGVEPPDYRKARYDDPDQD